MLRGNDSGNNIAKIPEVALNTEKLPKSAGAYSLAINIDEITEINCAANTPAVNVPNPLKSSKTFILVMKLPGAKP